MSPTRSLSPAADVSAPLPLPDGDETVALPKKRLHLLTRLSQRGALGLLQTLTYFVQRLSRPAALRFGERLGRLAYRVAKKPRQTALRNLNLVYGDAMDATERAARTKAVFEQFGKSIVDFLRAPTLSDDQMRGLVTTVEGWEHVEAARADGKGFIIVTGHIGNFELLGRYLAFKGVPSTAVARDPVDPALAAYARRMREYKGNVMLSKGVSARDLLTHLGKGEVITLGVDQNSGDIFLPFLGIPAGTVTGPAKLALLRKVPLLPVFCLREPDDTYRIVVLPPILPAKSDNKDAEIERLTREVNQAVESLVHRAPDQWLWLHNRWKSAFEQKNQTRLPDGYDYALFRERWRANVS